jgi:uncharacterized Zn finger protein
MSYFDRGYRPYVTAAARRRKAEREMKKLAGKGRQVSPVVITGRTIAKSFWGKAWCDNLERYSDYENRLPRGRTYARNGSVIDLQVTPGEVKALVSGSAIYRVSVKVAEVPKSRWASICTDCAGAIDSLVELLQGRFSKAVMERVCQRSSGLFPAPAEIEFSCSCPDWASLCKHIAAVLYGIGARLDEEPALLFALRKVDEKDLLARAGKGAPLSKMAPVGDRILADDGLSELFGLEMGTLEGSPDARPATGAVTRPRGGRRAAKVATAPAKPRAAKATKGAAKPSIPKATKVAAKPRAAKATKVAAKPRAAKATKVAAKPRVAKATKPRATSRVLEMTTIAAKPHAASTTEAPAKRRAATTTKAPTKPRVARTTKAGKKAVAKKKPGKS